MNTIILHIDMDCFFAQLEERENPRFKGQPIVVGADPKGGEGRGVVSTCNYEAREYGIHSAMPISIAFKKCPKAIFLPVNKEFYAQVSENIFRLIDKITDNYEKVSLDEAYLDLSEQINNYSEAQKIGEQLKEYILRQEDITCSVGIGNSKMIAKLACEENKPDGLKVVKPSKINSFIKSKPITSIPGIGPKTRETLEEVLKKQNLEVKDIRSLSQKQLVDEFGKKGKDIYNKVRGKDNSEIEESATRKSIGKELTFEENTNDPEKIVNTFQKLSKKVAKKAEAQHRLIKTVVITCRFEGFNTYNRQVSFSPVNPSEELIYKKGIKLLLQLITEKAKPVRLLGIRVLFE